jgi:hypothetical protein
VDGCCIGPDDFPFSWEGLDRRLVITTEPLLLELQMLPDFG